MRWLFIVNPAAGHGRGERRWERGSPEVLRACPGAEVWTTAGPGAAVALARRAIERFEGVVAVGGDGTLGEVVDGYLAAPESLRARVVLGTWPMGSGCDLARHLRISPEPQGMLRLLSQGRPRLLDAGSVEFSDGEGRPRRRFFINVAALGLAGEVALRAQAGGKPWGGALSYLLTSLGAILDARAATLELCVDGERLPAAAYHLVVVANTSSFGGGMRVAPGADAQDGRLDLVAVGDLTRWGLLRRFPLIYTGGHLGVEGVTHRLVRRLEVRSREKVTLNIDGEAIGTLPAVFEVRPKAVPFLCPA